MTRIALLFTLLLTACMPDESQRTFGGPDGDMPGAADEPLDTARPEMPGQEAQADTSWTRDAVSVDRNVYSVLLDVRTASHDGFDRIVMSFGPSAVPGHRVEYVRPPVTQCGSGEEVDLPGTGFLSIRMRPAAAHSEEGHATVSDRNRRFELPVLIGLVATCDFEADLTWVAALRTPNAFRVFELESPNRLVIDIRHRM